METNLDTLAIELLEQDLKGGRYNKDYSQTLLRAARCFITWIKTNGNFKSLKRKVLIKYQTWLGTLTNKYTGQHLARSTLKQRYEAVKKLCSLLYRSGAIKENPAHGLELRLPGERRAFKRRPLSREEITKFLESIPTNNNRELRNRAFFELIYSSGLRMSEALTLKIGNIDLRQREAKVKGKYDRERIVPLSDIARDFLKRYLGERKNAVDEYVFPGSLGGCKAANSPMSRTTMSRIFRELLERCGIKKPELCTHSIRHSTATHLLDNGAGVRHVQELLGHRSIESTVLYTHVQTEGLARVYRKYLPRDHELFEIIDASYDKRLESILYDHKGRLLTGERLSKQNGRVKNLQNPKGRCKIIPCNLQPSEKRATPRPQLGFTGEVFSKKTQKP
jgi:integrase/recombinase XerD